jgi:ribosomal protein S18 acetylase RimI-like enzyme
MVQEEVRSATEADFDAVTNTLWLAFGEDPLWRWVFPEHAKLEPWWRLLIGGALRHGWVWILGDFAAASVWIPPGREELTPDEEDRVEPLFEELIGTRAADAMKLLERFDASHPRDTPHYYLSILGTHPSHRGRGLGMSLLAHNLRRIDEEGMPAYLESSNPANDRRYEGVGFERVGEFSTPDGRHTLTTMWRQPRSGVEPPPRALATQS